MIINYRIVFSYAREDWPFVERTAQALRLYFARATFTVDNGHTKRTLPNVFAYTQCGKPFEWYEPMENESEDRQREQNEQLADRCYKQILEQANVFVLFSYKRLIKEGAPNIVGVGRWQAGELNAWHHINAPDSFKVQYMVDFEKAHDDLRERRSPHWGLASGALWDADESRPSGFISVNAYDLYSARLVAERILRHLLFGQDLSAPPPTDTVFSYEKRIVQMYHEIPNIIQDWCAEPSNDVHQKHMLKLLAYIKAGVPPYWPCVSLQADFTHTSQNPLVDSTGLQKDSTEMAIGSPRKGPDMLWPTDAPQADRHNKPLEPDVVVAAALSKYHRRSNSRACMLDEGLAFPEAGPRQRIYASSPERVAIIVSGGIAPGINAVIDGIVHRQQSYWPTTEVLGVNHGFFGLKEWDESFVKKLIPEETSGLATKGGSCLKTCRLKDLLPESNVQKGSLAALNQKVNQAVEELGLPTGSKRSKQLEAVIETLRQPNSMRLLETLTQHEDPLREKTDLNVGDLMLLRREALLKEIVETLVKERIKILYIIGGDGTMRAAHHLAQTCRQYAKHVSVVGIPKTMDNDILWVWQSFGFATAVERARENIEHLATEVDANPRICVLQLFGSASGFVVSHAVLASSAGICDFALIPEMEFSVDTLAWKLAIKIAKDKRMIPFGLVVMAESAIPSAESCTKYKDYVGLTNAEKQALDKYLTYRREHDDRFPDGQITNELRSAGLKLVSEGLKRRVLEIFTNDNLREQLKNQVGGLSLPDVFVNDEEHFRVFTNEPRHLLRSVPPSFSDVIMGNRLGALAVDNAAAGYTGFMISQWLTEFVMVPLDLVALGRKHIPQDGIFWKSVLAKTGQGQLD